jgi:hypothetical protein
MSDEFQKQRLRLAPEHYTELKSKESWSAMAGNVSTAAGVISSKSITSSAGAEWDQRTPMRPENDIPQRV